MNKKCKHNNVSLIVDTAFEIPEGWDALQEKGDIDMEQYALGNISNKWICNECEEVLEED